jgi:hypothetical protein
MYSLPIASMTPELCATMMAHGMRQKLQDEATRVPTGSTMAAKTAKVDACYMRLASNDWKVHRAKTSDVESEYEKLVARAYADTFRTNKTKATAAAKNTALAIFAIASHTVLMRRGLTVTPARVEESRAEIETMAERYTESLYRQATDLAERSAPVLPDADDVVNN